MEQDSHLLIMELAFYNNPTESTLNPEPLPNSRREKYLINVHVQGIIILMRWPNDLARNMLQRRAHFVRSLVR